MKSTIILLCIISPCLLLNAQQTSIDEADTTKTKQLAEVTVSANRWEQNTREVAARISPVEKSLIEIQNPQTAADLLSISDHVFVQKSQLGGGSPMIRGFATNRVLLVVDGIRMNNAIFRSGNVQNVISLDANTISRAEVVFGPGSVMYGSDAIGGVMDFHTLDPRFSNDDSLLIDGNAMARYSSANDENTFHIDFNVAGKRLSFLSSLTRSVYDDLKMGSSGPEEYLRPDYIVSKSGVDVVRINGDPEIQKFTGYDQWNSLQKLSYRVNQHASINYAFHFSKTSDYNRYDRLILRDENDMLVNAEWYYGPQKWMMHALQFNMNKTTSMFDQAKLIIALQDFEESRHNRSFQSFNRTDRKENVKAFSVNLDMDKSLTDATTLFYGAEFVTNKVKSTASRTNITSNQVTSTSTRYPDGSDWRSSAVYGSIRININHNWIVSTSARVTNIYTHSRFDKTFFDFPFDEAEVDNTSLNGSVGIVYLPNVHWKFYLNASTGFRSPNVDDIGKVFDSEPGNVIVPNPSLRPEQAYNIETGFAGVINENVKLDLSAYYTFLDNAISRGTTTFNGNDSVVYDGQLSRVLSLQNISEITVAGVQGGLDFKLHKFFSLRSSINYQKGKENDPSFDSDHPPTHISPMFGAAHLIFDRKKLMIDFYTNFNGKISYEDLPLSEKADAHLYAHDDNGNPYAPSWLTLNAKTNYQLNEKLSFSGGVENIFNRRYRPYSSGISAPGRNLIFSLKVQL